MAAKKRVFISFDYDNDAGVKAMLAGQSRLPDSPFEFVDASVKSHLTGDWQQKVKARMRNVDVVVVLCSPTTGSARGVVTEVELARSAGVPYFLLAAYSDKTCRKPSSALPSDKVYSWTWDNLKVLIGGGR